MTMALNILDSTRLDRYMLEVFIGRYNFIGNTPDKISNPSKNEEANSKTKYTIKLILDGILDTEIAGYDKVEEKEEQGHKDECTTYFNDQPDSNIDLIRQQYIVEKPICNAYTVCYNIANKDSNDEYMSLQPTINKGVICIFACVPRTLITLLQRNTFEIMVCEKTENDEIVFGIISLSLSGAMGFTDAIAYHFYEKGYDKHSHTSEHFCDVRSTDGTQSVGDIFIRFKLTCCGPEVKEVNQIWFKPGDRSPQLDPIFVNDDPFDYPFDKYVLNFPLKMIYDDVHKSENKIQSNNPDIKKLLHCQSIQNYTEKKQCTSCPCKELLANVAKIMFDDEKQRFSECKQACMQCMHRK